MSVLSEGGSWRSISGIVLRTSEITVSGLADGVE